MQFRSTGRYLIDLCFVLVDKKPDSAKYPNENYYWMIIGPGFCLKTWKYCLMKIIFTDRYLPCYSFID